MGREVRRVPANWQHPRNADGRYVPLSDGYYKHVAEWDEEARQWSLGRRRDYSKDGMAFCPRSDDPCETYAEYAGERPDHREYMPDWPEEWRTHWQMYEDTTEGTPISPVCETPEQLAHWLADNGASAFADMTATFEQWMATINQGGAISMVMGGGAGLRSGVAAAAETHAK